MLIGGYLGEADTSTLRLVHYRYGWLGYILMKYSQVKLVKLLMSGNKALGIRSMRMIVTVGWAIYPLGYVFGYLTGGVDNTLNVVYNLADFINKIAFGLVIWAAAVSSGAGSRAR